MRRLLLSLALLLTPAVALAAPRTFAELVNGLVSIINVGVATLVGIGLVIYLYGIATNILKFEGKPEIAKAYFLWGIIIFFVMLSIWGILNLARNVLFDAGLRSAAPTEIRHV